MIRIPSFYPFRKILNCYLFSLLFCSLIFAFSNFSYARQVSKEEEAMFVAQKAQEDGFYEVALGLYESFLESYPQSKYVPEVNLYIGQCYFFQDKFLDALSKFNELLADPKAESISDACVYWIAEVHFRGNDFKQAAAYYQKITEQFPRSEYVMPAYYSLGWCLYQIQDYKGGLKYFKMVTEKSQDKSLIYDAKIKIMDCFYYLKEYQELKKFINNYFQTMPQEAKNNNQALFYLAEADYYLGNYDQAIEIYSQLISNTSDDKLFNLASLGSGWSYIKLEKYQEAETVFKKINKKFLDTSNLEILLLGKAILFNRSQDYEQSLKANMELLNFTSDLDNLTQAYLGVGEALYNLDRYNEAIEHYSKVSDKIDLEKANPELVDKLYYAWAWAHLKNSEFKEAINKFQKVASRSNDKIVKIACLCLAADAYQDAGEYEKAIEMYDQILKDYPDSLYSDYIQYQLGISLLRMSNYDSAILVFKTLAGNFPKSKLLDKAAYSLALTYFQKEEYDKTIEVLNEFLQNFSDSLLRPEALYLRGSSLYNMGKFSQAIEIFKEIIRSYGENNKSLAQKADYEIAECLYQLGKEDKAVARFKALRSKYPDSNLTIEVLWWLGAYYYRAAKHDLAQRYFEAIINDFAKSNLVTDATYAMGSIYEEKKEYSKAQEAFQKVIEIGEPDLAGQATLAICDIYVKMGNPDLALKMYKQALGNYPNLAVSIYPKIAQIYKSQTDYEQAILYYRKAMDVSTLRQLGGLQFKIAESLQLDRKLEQAIEEYLKVAYLYPQDNTLCAKALIRAASIYEERHLFQEALELYRKVTSMNVQEGKFAQERIEEIENQI